jgi:hypothetical protein
LTRQPQDNKTKNNAHGVSHSTNLVLQIRRSQSTALVPTIPSFCLN